MIDFMTEPMLLGLLAGIVYGGIGVFCAVVWRRDSGPKDVNFEEMFFVAIAWPFAIVFLCLAIEEEWLDAMDQEDKDA